MFADKLKTLDQHQLLDLSLALQRAACDSDMLMYSMDPERRERVKARMDEKLVEAAAILGDDTALEGLRKASRSSSLGILARHVVRAQAIAEALRGAVALPAEDVRRFMQLTQERHLSNAGEELKFIGALA